MHEAEEVDLQMTTGLHTDDYWYGGQTTIRFVCKPLLVRTSNHYWFECERLLHRALPQQLRSPAYEVITLSAALKRGSSSEIPY